MLSSTMNWIDNQHDNMVKMLIDWSQTNSGSFNITGLKIMYDKIATAFQPLNVVIDNIPLKPLEIINDDGAIELVPIGNALHIKKQSKNAKAAKIKVLLCGHLDTVFAADDSFQQVTVINHNRLNGPGVADMKGGIIVMLTALKAIEQSPYADAIHWEVLINPDEEIGSISSAPLLRQVAVNHQVGMIYEPSMPDGTLAGERKGSGNFSIIVRGRSAHAGREHHLGRNAIVHLARVIEQLNNLNLIGYAQHTDCKQADFTVNIGRVTGGGAVNIVPDLAICRFNIRVNSFAAQQQVQQLVNDIVANLNNAEYQVELHGQFTRPPKPMNHAQQKLFNLLKQCGTELNIPINTVATGGCCDGNNLLAAGLPNIDTLGVRGGNIHSHDEYILLDSLTERAKLSTSLLIKFAQSGF